MQGARISFTQVIGLWLVEPEEQTINGPVVNLLAPSYIASSALHYSLVGQSFLPKFHFRPRIHYTHPL